MIIMERIRGVLRFGRLSEKQYQAITERILDHNYMLMNIYFRICIVFFIVVLVFSQHYIDISVDSVVISAGCLLAFAIYEVILVVFVKKNRKFIQVLEYLYVITLLFGTAQLSYSMPQQTGVFFIVTLTIIPALIQDQPIRILFLIYVSAAFYIFISVFFKPYEIVNLEIKNIMIALVSGTLLTLYITKDTFTYLYKQELKQRLANIDTMTGLRNRNCYENDLQSFDTQYMIVVYVDADHLHDINNTYGHTAGDAFIKAVAYLLVDLFGKENTYRVGGDEFIGISFTQTYQNIEYSMKEITDTLAKKHYEISYGIAQGDGLINYKRLVKSAEIRMNKEKALHHKLQNER